MMTFNPKDHLTDIKGKDYLPARARVQWFRHDYPVSEGKGRIITDIVNIDPAIVQAKIIINGEIVATGTAQCMLGGNSVYKGREIEKAETSAISRALAVAGYGTQFSHEFDDSDHLADSPSPAPHSGNDSAGGGQRTGAAANGAHELAETKVTQIVKATKAPRKGGTMIKMETVGGRTCTMFSADLLRNAGYAEADELKEVGDWVTWPEDNRPTVTIVIDGKFLNVTAVQPLIDAHFGERETAPMPGMPDEEAESDSTYSE